MPFKKIFNSHEAITHAKLQETCEKYGATVYPKIRIADILPIENSGIPNDLYRYALQAHFDFVIAGVDNIPLFSVEYDGPTHQTIKQIARDNKKEKICETFGFPLLRINTKHIEKKYRNFDLLSWFIEVWFWREAFFNAQETGIIPDDEIFDPSLIFEIPNKKGLFPLRLSLEPLRKIQELANAEKIKYPSPTGEWIGVDKLGNYHGIIWLWIDDETGVYAQTAMRTQRFPVVESDILSEILIFLLYEEIVQVLTGKAKAKQIDKIVNNIQTFTSKYEVRMSSMSHMPSNNLPNSS